MTPHLSRAVLFAHPVADLYGSDRQLLESVRATTRAGHRAVVVLPAHGELVARLEAAQAEVVLLRFPVLRRSILNPIGILRFICSTALFLVSSRSLLRSHCPDLVYVNTLTIPVWLIAARLFRIPSLCHVHEAEDEGSRIRRRVLVTPLRMAERILVNSHAARECLLDAVPTLSPRIRLVYNGVVRPTAMSSADERHDQHTHLVCVGRLSPRKGTDLALEAVALVRHHTPEVRLTIAGDCFAGYEWFENDLRRRAQEPDLAGSVAFVGYVDDVYGLLATADLAVVPSRREPFGNTAVEAQLAGVPLIAARTQGLTEIVADGETGLLFTQGDAFDLAAKIRDVLHDREAATRRARRAQASAEARFGTAAYAGAIVAAIDDMTYTQPTRAA